MNAYASSSTSTRAPHHARTFSSGSSLLWDLAGSAMYPIGQEQLQYDARGRLLPFIETSAQKRERERLLKRKEHARRVNKWLEESSSKMLRSTPSPVADRRFHFGDRPDSITEDEDEPYILYSTSSRSSSPYNTSPLSSSSASSHTLPSSPFDDGSDQGSLKASSRKSSRSSLGSITEEAGEEGSPCV